MQRLLLITLLSFIITVKLSNQANLQQLSSNRNVGYSKRTPVEFTVNFFGRRYNKFWIEWKSGLVSFDENAAYDTDEVKTFPNPAYRPNAFNAAQMDTPLIAVYYANAKRFHGANITVVTPQTVNQDNAANVSQWCRDVVKTNVPDTGSFTCDNFAIVTWIGSGPGGTFAQGNYPRNSYQILIATSGEESFAIFNYYDLKWHADQNNGGNEKGIIENPESPNFPKVGFNMGDGRRFLSLPFSGKSVVIGLSEGDATSTPKSWLSTESTLGVYVYRISNKVEVLVGSCHLGALSQSPNDHHRRLLISPQTGYFLGGQQVTIRGQCFDPNVVYDIRFETEPEITVGCNYVDKMTITCVLTEWFLRRGYIPFRLFENKVSTKFTGNFYATIVGAGISMQNYGQMAGKLEIENIPISWDRNVFASSKSDHLIVSLYGYRELEESEEPGNLTLIWSEETKNPIFDHLRQIGNVSSPEISSYVIEAAKIRCKTGPDCKRMDSGVFAVEDPTTGRRIWSRPFQIGWLYTRLEEDPKTSAEICLMRYTKEKSRAEEDWREPISTCPCSQKQAQADFRFAREDQFLGFGDSTRCYISYPIRGSTGASQCCYRVDDSAILVYSNDSAKPDAIDSPALRAHYVGGFPFNQYGRVPIFSYLSTDAILKYTCCLWSQKSSPTSCSYYKEVRATKDCSPYRTPHLASAYGLGHIKTFRGTFYQFYGKGEYVLVKGDRDDVVIQARYEQVLNANTYEPVQATGITAIGAKIGCKYGTSKAYVQHTKNDPPGLYVYVDGVKQDYIEIRFRDRQILKNVIESPCITVIYEIADHVESVILHLADGPVVRIKAVQQVLNIDVQMPDNSKRYPTMPRYSGLFGELSEDSRESGFDLYDLESNRIIEPNEIQNPARIETLASKMLVRDLYESVMLWLTDGLKPSDYHDPAFRAEPRKYREEVYQVVTQPPEPETTVPATEAPTTATAAAKIEETTMVEITTAAAVNQTQHNPLNASPMNALARKRRRRDVYIVSAYTESADAYDLRMTNDARLQTATKMADAFSSEYQRDLVDKQEAYCPYLNIPNAVKSTKNTRAGAEVTIRECNPGFKLINTKPVTYRCKAVEGAKKATAVWEPEPALHCSMVTLTQEVAQESFSTFYIVIIALAALIVVAVIIGAIIIIRNKSAKKSKTAAAGEAAAKYGVEVAYTEETSPLNEPKQPFSRPTSGMPPSPGPLSPTATTTTSGQAGGGQQFDDSYTSPVTIQPPTAFPPSTSPTHSPAPVVRQDDEV